MYWPLRPILLSKLNSGLPRWSCWYSCSFVGRSAWVAACLQEAIHVIIKLPFSFGLKLYQLSLHVLDGHPWDRGLFLCFEYLLLGAPEFNLFLNVIQVTAWHPADGVLNLKRIVTKRTKLTSDVLELRPLPCFAGHKLKGWVFYWRRLLAISPLPNSLLNPVIMLLLRLFALALDHHREIKVCLLLRPSRPKHGIKSRLLLARLSNKRA